MKTCRSLVVSGVILGFLLTNFLPATASSASGATTRPPRMSRGVTIYVWDPFPAGKKDVERATLRNVVRGWERLSGNTVVLLGSTSNNATRLCRDGAAGHAPDLVGVSHEELAQLYACKVIAPIPAWAWPDTQQHRYVQPAAEAVRIDGREWGIPWSIETSGIYYNSALVSPRFFAPSVRRVGKQLVRVALSWPELIARAQQLTDHKSGRFGLAFDPTNLFLDYAFLTGKGGYVFKRSPAGFDWRQLGLDSRGSIAGAQFIRDLTTAGRYKLVPGTMGDARAISLFALGKVAMCITGSWNEPLLQERPIPLGFAPLPAFGSHRVHPFASVQVFTLNRFSGHPNEALWLLRYMTQHMQLPEFRAANRVPVLESALRSPAIQAHALSSNMAVAVRTADPVPNIPQMNEVWGPMNHALVLVARGQSSPVQAVRSATKLIRRRLGI